MKNNGASPSRDTTLTELRNISWDFQGQRSRSPFSATHFYPARFISQLPSALISTLTNEGDIVLDPYCGSGTTLIEANRLSRRSTGFDINPISKIILTARTQDLTSEEVAKILGNLMSNLVKVIDNGKSVSVPQSVQLSKWYDEIVGYQLAKLYSIISDIDDEIKRTICLFCFSSILLKVCRETRHWGYVCDNTEPKDHPRRDVLMSLKLVSEQLVSGYRAQRKFLGNLQHYGPTVYVENSNKISQLVKPNSIDLVVTSPPYYGVVDYVKAQRLSMEWLGIDMESYRKQETGARSKRHRKNSLSEFTNELSITFQGISTVLKPEKYCAVVFGASKRRQFNQSEFINAITSGGMLLVDQIDRNISSQRRFNPSLTSETLYILQKPF